MQGQKSVKCDLATLGLKVKVKVNVDLYSALS